MSIFKPGLVHVPVTPFKADQSIDYDLYAKVIEFHLKNGADSLAVPMQPAEDVSLRETELRQIIDFAIKQVKGRVPVIAHVSDPGTGIAVERARFAEKAGASAIASHPPYFWHPKPSMVVEHLVQIGSATHLPFFICTPLVEDAGTHLTGEIVMDVIKRLDNIAGLIDSSMRFVFMAETISLGREVRPDFQLLSGTDFMVPNAAVGGTGAFSPLSSVAPKLARQLYELCTKQQLVQARALQEDMAELHHLVKQGGRAGLKTAMRAMGRECGDPRLPGLSLGEPMMSQLAARVAACPYLSAEPRGW